MKLKKSQIRMAETVAILFIFFLMIGFGFVFYARIQKTSLKETTSKNLDLASIEVTQRVSFLPELQCSSKNVITDNCIDLLKLNALISILYNSENPYYDQNLLDELYFDLFRYSNITIIQIYPGEEKRWTLYERIREDSSFVFTPVPISLYNATTKSYAFGVLEVRFYS